LAESAERRGTTWIAWLAVVIAVAGVIAWTLRVAAVDVGVIRLQAMMPMNAAMVILCSAALITASYPRLQRASKPLAAVALVASLTSGVHDAIGILQGGARFDATFIDELSPNATGWPAPNTAFCLALIAIALLATPGTVSNRTTARRIVVPAAVLALLVAIVTLVGALYGVDPLRGLPGHLSMALNTAIAVATLAIAILLEPNGGALGALLRGRDAGALLARLALPATILLPIALGALKVWSDRSGWFGPTMGTALRTMAEMVLFGGLAMVAVNRLRRLDRERERLMDEERRARAIAEDRDEMLASFFRTPDIMISVIESDVSDAALAKPEVDYRFLLANAQAASLFAKPAHEVIGRTASELGFSRERRRSFVELLAEAHRTSKPTTVERPGSDSRSDVQIPWISVVISPLAVQAGRIPRFCLIATDVTPQRRLQEELRQSQKLEAVGRLAGGVAHDFNNLLTAITGFTRFALEDVPNDSTVRDDLEQALLAADRAAGLTHQLLAFSRQQVLQPKVLDLNQLVAGIEPMLRRIIGADIKIHLRLATSLGAVRADRGQLEQVVVNLAVNARDAMPHGGTLTIETGDIELDETEAATMHGGTPGRHVVLAVSDTGEGMTAETRERIFEPFFTTKEPGRGTGLGLATVFGIVRQSGGGIWVSSDPGHGTTFKVYLPRYEGPADVLRPVTPVTIPLASGRVLLVEDDPAVRAIAARALNGGGYDVVEARTGREGLALFNSLGGRVDVVVTDLVLPELGGKAMVQALLDAGLTAPVVYMSGYTAEAMSAQSILEPGDQFVEKPFTPQALLTRVRDATQTAAIREPRRAG